MTSPPAYKLHGVGVGILEVRDRATDRLLGHVQREDGDRWLGMRLGGGNWLVDSRNAAAKWVADA